MIFPVAISCVSVNYRNMICINMFLMSFLLPFVPVTLQAETVYIKNSLLVGLHEDKSIDSAILKVLPTGTALEVLKREDDFVKVRSPKGVAGWISKSYLMANDPDKNQSTDATASAAQARIRELEAEVQNIKMQHGKTQQARTEQQLEQSINSDETTKLKIENEKLRQQINSDKLKSGELQAKLAELKNLISQNGSNKGLTDKIKLLTEKNTQLEDEIKQFQQDRKIAKPFVDDLDVYNPVILSVIALLLGLLIGIILMDWRARQRHGGLRF